MRRGIPTVFAVILAIVTLFQWSMMAQTTKSTETSNNTSACAASNSAGCVGAFAGFSDNESGDTGAPIITHVIDAAPQNLSIGRTSPPYGDSSGDVHNLLPPSQRGALVFATIQAWFTDPSDGSATYDGVSYPTAVSHLMNNTEDCTWQTDCRNSSTAQPHWNSVVRDLYRRGYNGVFMVSDGGASTCNSGGDAFNGTQTFTAVCQPFWGAEYRIGEATDYLLGAIQNADGGEYASTMKLAIHYSVDAYKYQNIGCGNADTDWMVRCVQRKLKADFAVYQNSLFNTSQYYKVNGRPVVVFFDRYEFNLWSSSCSSNSGSCVVDNMPACTSNTSCWDEVYSELRTWMNNTYGENPMFIFRDGPGFGYPSSDGGFMWIQKNNAGTKGASCPTRSCITTATQTDWKGVDQPTHGQPDPVDYFYSQANANSSKLAILGAYKGFDSRNASWWYPGNPVLSQQCGQTWLATFAYTSNYSYSAQIVVVNTWDDYEEGHEIQSGIDNCVDGAHFELTSITNNDLQWQLPFSDTTYGTPNTLAKFRLFDSVDSGGSSMQTVADIDPSGSGCPFSSGTVTCSVNLQSYQWTYASHYLMVKAFGQPGIQNHFSTNYLLYQPAPHGVASPSSIAFPSTPAGQQSASQSITLTNSGTAILTLQSITVPSGFQKTMDCSNYSLPNNGGSCSISVAFSPTTCGSYSGYLTFNDNDPAGAQSVQVTGTGTNCTGPAVGFTPASGLSFGDQTVGTTSGAQTLTVKNAGGSDLTIQSMAITGTNSGDFAISSNSCPSVLHAGSSCSVSIKFDPAAQGARNAQLTVSGNSSGSAALNGIGTVSGTAMFANVDDIPPGQWTTAFSGQGTATGMLADSTGTAEDGNSAEFELTGGSAYSNLRWETPLTNNSNLANYTMDADLYMTDSSIPQGFYMGFAQAVNNSYLPFKFYCDFRDLGTNGIRGQWDVWDGAGQTWIETAISCTPNMFPANTWVHVQFEFERTSTNQLHYETITVNGQSTSVNIYTNPATQSPDSLYAEFEELGNSSQTPYSIWVDKWNVTATPNPSPAPNYSISPSYLSFSNQGLNTTSAAQRVTIINTSASSQTMSSVSTTGDFAKMSTSSCTNNTTLQPQASCYVDVLFTPTANGTRPGTLVISGTTDATVYLTGIGGTATFTNVDQLGGWSLYADSGATGALTQGVANPSQDGDSAQFQIGGTTPYSNVHWEDTLPNNSALSHYTIEADVYVTDPSVVQAFRFGLYQAVNNQYFPFQLLCDVQSGGIWKVWNASGQSWTATNASCAPLTDIPADTWVHLSIDFERNASNQLDYQSVTINANTTTLNVLTNPSTRSPDTIIAVFGENGNSTQSTYSVWVDRWNITAW